MRKVILPWIKYERSADDSFPWVVTDTRTNESRECQSEDDVAQFVADHSKSFDHMPIGDAIHTLTSFLGLKRCGNCAARQALLNNVLRKP